MQLLIFPPTMYCTVQGGESTDLTSVNCSPVYICGTLFINYVTPIQVGWPTFSDVSNPPKLSAASDNYWKKFSFQSSPPNTGQGIHIYSQQSLLKFLQLCLLLSLHILHCYIWTLAASELILVTS